ncbi:hypothetical protein ACFLQU_04775 [Verrucomicrobiota bacterium]
MKTPIMIVAIVGAVVCAYLVGHSQGRSSGFEDGAVWAGQSADMCKGMRAIAILGVLEQTNYTRVAEALNHDIDYAILGALRADEHLADIRLPRKIQKQEESIREAFKPSGTDEATGYRHFAEFRRKHPTDSTDKDIVKAVNQLIEKY